MLKIFAPLAQLVEHSTLNRQVQGSNPWRRTRKKRQFSKRRLSFLFVLLSFRYSLFTKNCHFQIIDKKEKRKDTVGSFSCKNQMIKL